MENLANEVNPQDQASQQPIGVGLGLTSCLERSSVASQLYPLASRPGSAGEIGGVGTSMEKTRTEAD